MRDKIATGPGQAGAEGLSREGRIMALALAEAQAAARRGEVPVGAVVIEGESGAVLARAGNETRALADPTAHAEMLAVRRAARRLGVARLSGCDLYVTLEPCAMCAAAISHARIRRLYYAAADPKGGAVEQPPALYQQPTCLHAPEVVAGLLAGPAAELLRLFFSQRR